MTRLPKTLKASATDRTVVRCAGGSINFAAPSGDQQSGPEKFSMVAYTGGLMQPYGWMDPIVVDLTGLKFSGHNRAILKDHSQSMIVGHTQSIKVQANQLVVEGVISGGGQVAREVVAASRNGFPWQASIGASVQSSEKVKPGAKVTVNGQEFTGPITIIRTSVLDEVSFVAIGADNQTTAAVAAQKESRMKFSQWLQLHQHDPAKITAAQRESLKKLWVADLRAKAVETDTAMQEGESSEEGAELDELDDVTATLPVKASDRSVAGNTSTADAPTASDLEADYVAESRRIVAARRIFHAPELADLRAQAISEGWTEDKMKLEQIRAERGRGVTRPAGIHTGNASDRPSRAAVIEAAALMQTAGIGPITLEQRHRYSPQVIDQAMSASSAGMSLQRMVADVLAAHNDASGIAGRPEEAFRRVLKIEAQLGQRRVQASNAGFTTVSLSGILSNVANKTLLDAFLAMNSVAVRIARRSSHSDFKTNTRYRLTAGGQFEPVGPSGELKHGSFGEETYTNKVGTRGKIVTLTREMLKNDDLQAFLDLPAMLGRQGAIARERAVFTLLLANPGTPAFFSTNNKNLSTGAGSTLTIAGLTAAELLFLNQVDTNGDPILISPKILLVGTALKDQAYRLMNSREVNETTTANVASPTANPHAGKFQVEVSPYINSQALDGQSATAFYLLGDPNIVPAIDIAYLDGRDTPVIEGGTPDFDTLGMSWRAYYDFGVALVDPRAAVRSAGA